MGNDLATTLADLADHLAELVKQDDRLRDRLRSLVLAVLAPTELEPEPEHEAEAEAKPDRNAEDGNDTPPPIANPPPIEAPSPPAPEPEPEPEPLRKLTLGQAQPRPLPTPTAWATNRADEDEELTGLEVRCRLKAEGLRWAVRRRQIEAEGGDYRSEIAPRDRDLLDRAAAIRCPLWMNRPEYNVPADPAVSENAARWFEALAVAWELVRETRPEAGDGHKHREPALGLMAEAQSALRVAVARAGGHDADQFRAYQWLRSTTKREHIYLNRHMRLEDPANPADPAAFEARVAHLASRLRKGQHQGRKSQELLGQFRYHARRIAKQGGGDLGHDWRKLAEIIEGLIGEGIPPSAIELRELMLPILDQIPDDLIESSPAFGRVLREIDAYLATLPEPATAVEDEAEPTEDVARAAELLEGKVMVLIGGQCRPLARDAIRAAFRLKDLDWITTREHASIDRFEPNIARPEAALVVLAIRWSSHSFGEVKQFCDRHGKPMVRLPGGYGVNQLAAQILAQSSGQLRGD